MRNEIEFLKRAINRHTDGPFGCYHVRGGLAWAQNEQMSAVTPIITQAEFSVPAADLELALSRMASEPTAAVAHDGALSLKAGRLRATVPIVACEPPPTFSRDLEWKAFPPTLMFAIKVALSFTIGDAAGWPSSIRLMDGRVTSLNNRCGVDVAVTGLECAPSLIARETAEFLLSQEQPDHYFSDPGRALLFSWRNGRALKAQLVDQSMPEAVERILASAGRDAPVEITDDWRAACEDAMAIAEKTVEILPGAIRAERGSSNVEIEIETAVAGATRWENKVLAPLLEHATHWNPAVFPKPAFFKGPSMYGLVAGIKQ